MIDLEAALRAAREQFEAADRVLHDLPVDDWTRKDRYERLARAVGAAGMPCYRMFCSGLGPNEEDGDDARFEEFCHKQGYRMCERCKAQAEAERIAREIMPQEQQS